MFHVVRPHFANAANLATAYLLTMYALHTNK